MRYRALRALLLVLAVFFAITVLPAQQDQNEDIEYPEMDFLNPGLYVIKEINMIGVKSLSPDILVATSGMAVGDTVYIPGDYVSDATRKLWNQRYFSDIRVVVDVEGDNAILNFYLQERPRVYNWQFEGLKKGEITDLTEKLKLARGLELSDYRINSSMETILDYLRAKSYLNATVDLIQKNDPDVSNGVSVTFKVDKGAKVKVGDVTFEGNDNFRTKTLRKSLKKTKKKNMNIFVSSKFNESLYEEDKDRLIDYYNSKGYRNAVVVSDSLYDINEKRIGVHIKVDEGNKFYYRNISWLGNSKLTTEQLNMILDMRPGDAYDSKTMNERLGLRQKAGGDDFSVMTMYHNDGYLALQIDPQETIIEGDSIDVEIKMLEGRQMSINKVTFTGNERVNDQVIRREMDVMPGELYNRSLMNSTYQRLASSGFFDPATISPDIQPVSADLVDVSFALEETPSDNFEISGGWGANTFVGSVGIQLNNFSVKNFFKKGAWNPYPSGEGQQLGLRVQSNGTYYKSISLNFMEPWLGGKKPNSFSLGTYYSSQNDASYMWQKSDRHFRTFGVSAGLGRRLNWPDRYFTLYHEFMYQMYKLKDWDYFIMTNGTANIFAFRTTLKRSTLGDPIYPTKGSEFSATLTLTPPYSLFDNKDYKDQTMSDRQRHKWIEYHKWQFKGDWYLPISADEKFVLRAKAEMGFIGSYNQHKKSPFEGYEVGGDGISGYNIYGVDMIGLRGYRNGSLTPNNQYASAYNKYTVELRYPFVMQGQTRIFGLIFAEGGNAFDEVKNFDPFLVKRSAGFGLRVFLGFLGTIGVDWGYGFDRAADNSGHKGEVHFMMGQQF